jgi:hypothetical protein
MTREEIENGNKVIAEFMGGKLSKPRSFINSPYWKLPNHYTHLGNPDKVYDLYYNRFWDWLMPVVEKIKTDESVRVLLPMGGIKDSVMPFIEAIRPVNDALLKVDITKLFKAVVKFIEWYNLNKQSNGN